MKVEVREGELTAARAELTVVGLHEDGSLPSAVAAIAGAEGAPGGFKKRTLLRSRDGWLVIVGLGKRDDADVERLRVAAAIAAKEGSAAGGDLARLGAAGASDDAAEALVTGTILGSYRYERFKGADPDDPPPPGIESLTLLGPAGVAAAAEAARVGAEAANRARDLQMTPANVATPSFLAGRAEEIAAAHDAVTAEVLGPEQIAAKGMGGLVAVSRGSSEPARLIVLRYAGGGSGPTLGLVGKGVTFDSGGISLKPGAGMHEMKYDMSGAAAVLESVAAIAELGLKLDLVAVVPSTENMPSGDRGQTG